MKRRNFLRAVTGFGMAGVLPMSLIKTAYGAAPDRFLIAVNASGGWDPTSLIDPKGDAPRSDGLGPVNHYSATEIKTAGKIIYAPYSSGITPPATSSPGHLETFFKKHAKRIRVINGIDTQINGHDSGRRFVWSGKLEEGYPSVAALAAAPYAEQPMAFISNGGYDFAASLVAPVRTAGASTFTELAYPNSQFPQSSSQQNLGYFSNASSTAIQQARAARLTRLRIEESLPKRTQQMTQLETVRNSDVTLSTLLKYLPTEVSDGLAGQAEIALAAFASGLAVSANLNAGGFDTHGDHDDDQTSSLTELLEGLDHLWSQSEKLGMQNKVTVIVGSDFGRTPFYNNGDGKDHWNITSIMAMGAGITGNSVIGATDKNFNALKLNPSTLQTDSNSITVTPQHVHHALRNFLGVKSDLDKMFPIAVEPLALFA